MKNFNYYEIKNKKVINYIYIYTMAMIIMILFLIILCITCHYKIYYELFGMVIEENDNYYLQIFVPIEDIKTITQSNNVYIDKIKYKYKIYLIDDNIVLYDNKPSKKIILKINLEKEYQYKNMIFKIKFIKENKLIYKYILHRS